MPTKGQDQMKPESRSKITALIERYPSLAVCENDIVNATKLMIECYKNGGKIMTCGNGGSAADAVHIVGELMKGFCKRRELPNSEKEALAAYGDEGKTLAESLQGTLASVSLINEISLQTAFSNDVLPELGTAQQLYGLANKGDVFIGISTSGNAKNLYYASIVAKTKGCSVVILSGRDGGRLRQLADVSIIVPEKETFKIQELHLPVYHAICLALEEEFF